MNEFSLVFFPILSKFLSKKKKYSVTTNGEWRHYIITIHAYYIHTHTLKIAKNKLNE